MMEYYEYRANGNRSNFNLEKNKQLFDLNKREDLQIALQLLKDKIGASLHIALHDKSCCDDDLFLGRFLFVNNGNIDNAFNQLIKYLIYKQQNNSWLKNMSIFDTKIQLALRDGNPRVLRQRDRKGRKVLTFIASNWNPQKYSLIDVYRAFLITIDELLENIENQALGFVVIVDWTDVTMKQAMHLTPTVLKLMIDGLQDCVPANFVAIHFISQTFYLDVALTILKKFLTEQMQARLYFHGSNLSTLHNHINKDVLPPDLGGEGPNITTLDWYHFLLESSQTVDNNKSYKLKEVLQYSKIPSVKNG